MADFNKKIEIEVDIKSANKSLNQLEAEARDLNKELDKVGLDTKQVNNIKNSLQKIEAATEITKASAKEFKDSLIEATVRVTQAFVTTTGTLLSFAQTEEDAAATTAKLSQAMAIADSIEQVYNATKAIGEVRTKALALAEAQKTTATVAGTVATEGATVATGLLGTAIQFMLGPIGLVIIGITALTGLYFLFRKTAADTAKEQNKLNDSVKEFSDATTEASKAQLDLNRSKLKGNIEAQRQAIKDEQKAAQDNAQFLLNQEKKLVADIEELRKKGAAFDSPEIQKAEKELFDNRFTQQKANEALINNLVKKSSDFEIDVKTDAANQLLDLELEKFNTLNDFDSKRKVVALENAKELNDINARAEKGDETAAQDKLILAQKTANQLKAIAIEESNFQLSIREQETDKQLDDLSLIETKTARFREIELNRLKELDAFNTAISNGEIKSATELEGINNRAKNNTLKLLKEIKDETKAIADETKQISLDLLVTDLNKITQDIGTDLTNQLKALETITANELTKLDEEYVKSIEALGDINTKELEKQADELTKNYQVKKTVIKKGEEENAKVVKENTALRVFAEKSAQQDILESSLSTLDKIVKSEKETLAVRLDANQQLVDIQLQRLKLQEEEELRQAENSKKTQVQIDAIKAKYNGLKITIIETGKATDKALKLEAIVKPIEKVQEALTKLQEIKLFSDNAGINNFLNVITGLEKGLNGALEIFKKFKAETLTPEDVAAFASSLVDITNSIIQNAFQQNIDSFNKQLETLNEKKAEIEEDLQTSVDKIKELQSNLAQANIEDRSRVIKLIDIERKKEKQLQDQKRRAAIEEQKLQQRIREEKKKAFEAQKAASIIQAGIGTAVAVVGALGNQPFTPFNLVLAGIVGALGATQIALIASQPTPEFFEGGHTERGNSKEVAGVVHKNEWVAPAWMVESPKYRNNIQELEAARKGGFATGGFTSTEQTQNADVLNQTIRSFEALANRPVVVSVQEINSVSNSVNKVKVRSTL